MFHGFSAAGFWCWVINVQEENASACSKGSFLHAWLGYVGWGWQDFEVMAWDFEVCADSKQVRD